MCNSRHRQLYGTLALTLMAPSAYIQGRWSCTSATWCPLQHVRGVLAPPLIRRPRCPRTCAVAASSSSSSPASALQWLQVADLPAQEASPHAVVMPVFPLSAIEWPGSIVDLNIIDPAYRRMYDDILSSGARRFLVPFTRSLPGGRVRYAEMPEEDRRLHAIGSVLFLEDLREVSDITGDAVKYVTRHSVRGRARMLRLLNPSALFKTDSNGNKIDYLRAEVELLDTIQADAADIEDPTMGTEASEILSHELRQLGEVAQAVNEPRLKGLEMEPPSLALMGTWRLAESWMAQQMAVRITRGRSRLLQEAREWIATEQQAGRLPADLPVEHMLRGISAGVPELDDDFWEPLLGLLASSDARERANKLIELARTELQLLRARTSLRAVFTENEEGS